MKALPKFVHLSLMVAILLASMGFRVAVTQCAGKGETSISLFSEPGCCCKKASRQPMKDCGDMSCVLQRSVAPQSAFQTTSQQVAKKQVEPASYAGFLAVIRPVILEALLEVVLPPPMSGRDIGILHQTFLL